MDCVIPRMHASKERSPVGFLISSTGGIMMANGFWASRCLVVYKMG